MTIMQIITSSVNWGGMEQYAYDVAAGAIARGHKVIFVAKDDSDVVPNRIKELGEVYLLPIKSKFDFHSIKQLRKIIKAQKVDVVHVHQPKNIFQVRLAIRGLDVGLVHTVHFVLNPTSPDWLYRRIFNMPDVLIAVSDLVRARVLELYPNVAPNKVVSIINSIDPSRMHFTDKRVNDIVTIGYAGRIVREKGIEVLLDSLAELAARGVTFRALLAGTGSAEYTSVIKAKIADLGLGNQVEMVGFISQMGGFISGIDIAVLPSTCVEACSLMAAEYYACGVPLISSAAGGHTEFMASGVDGVLVAVGESIPLADALQDLIENPDKLSVMGAAARKKYETVLNFDKFVETTIAQYN